ncbi:uncharacterized protein METZ01_LOCUS138977 [marine metagenome]|uniref:Uncharacterized protein n=1 Tax=marine metagenome TaxID=408172 RepID=A0A381ZBG9_9ZZZZ
MNCSETPARNIAGSLIQAMFAPGW